MSRYEFQNLKSLHKAGTRRPGDARMLLRTGKWRGAMCLAGYILECRLKAKLMEIHRVNTLVALEEKLGVATASQYFGQLTFLTSALEIDLRNPGMAEMALKDRIKETLRAEFPPPDDWVDVSDGCGENIHIRVISKKFEDLREQEKQEKLWEVIDKSGLTTEEKHRISLALPYTPAEL